MAISMGRALGSAVLAAWWLVGAVATGAPQERSRWFARVEVSGTTVRVNDQAILTIRKANGGFKPGERARIAGERLRDAIRDGLEPDELRLDIDHEMRSRKVKRTVVKKVPKTVRRKVGKGKNAKVKKVVIQVSRRVRTTVTVRYEVEVEARLLGRGRTLAVARGADADAAGVNEPSDLAAKWRRELASALRLPGLSVSLDRQVIPLGERRTVRIGGVARGPIALRAEGGKASPVGAVLRRWHPDRLSATHHSWARTCACCGCAQRHVHECDFGGDSDRVRERSSRCPHAASAAAWHP
ncbi:MAG: hypothetical protein ACKO5K_07950 [Armatimonadota bacterium]